MASTKPLTTNAIGRLTEASKINPIDQGIRTNLNAVINLLTQMQDSNVLEEAVDYFKAGNYDAAIQLLRTAAVGDNASQNIKQQYSQLLTIAAITKVNAVSYPSLSVFLSAKTMLEEALIYDPDNDQAKKNLTVLNGAIISLKSH